LIILFALLAAYCGSFDSKTNRTSKGDINDEFFPEDKPEKTAPEKSKPANVKNSSSMKNNPSTENSSDISRGYAAKFAEIQGKPSSEKVPQPDLFTGAHRNFKTGSLVLVRNLENGKKKLVKITEHGPDDEAYVIKVSFDAARALGFADKKSARVEVELIEDAPETSVANAETNNSKNDENSAEEDDSKENIEKVSEKSDIIFTDGDRPQNYTIRTGAFKNLRYAEKYREELEDKYNVNGFLGKQGKWNFVWVGDFETKDAAKKFYQQLKTDGLDVLNPRKVP